MGERAGAPMYCCNIGVSSFKFQTARQEQEHRSPTDRSEISPHVITPPVHTHTHTQPTSVTCGMNRAQQTASPAHSISYRVVHTKKVPAAVTEGPVRSAYLYRVLLLRAELHISSTPRPSRCPPQQWCLFCVCVCVTLLLIL